jgi:hypothetical protein
MTFVADDDNGVPRRNGFFMGTKGGRGADDVNKYAHYIDHAAKLHCRCKAGNKKSRQKLPGGFNSRIPESMLVSD